MALSNQSRHFLGREKTRVKGHRIGQLRNLPLALRVCCLDGQVAPVLTLKSQIPSPNDGTCPLPSVWGSYPEKPELLSGVKTPGGYGMLGRVKAKGRNSGWNVPPCRNRGKDSITEPRRNNLTRGAAIDERVFMVGRGWVCFAHCKEEIPFAWDRLEDLWVAEMNCNLCVFGESDFRVLL